MNRQEEFAVDGPASVSIDVKSGSIDVRVGGAGRVVVTLDGPDVAEWSVTQLGGNVSVDTGSRRGWRTRSARVLVEVPAGSDVDVSAASAQVTLTGEVGSTRIRTASGDVRTGDVARLDVNTASGGVRSDGVGGGASCTTASGDVYLGGVGGRLVVSTASGDVRVAGASDAVEIGSASGDIRVDRYDGTDILVRSVSGDVRLGLPAGIRVEPDISTLSGRTTLPAPASPAAEPTRTVRVGLRTVTGDIVIERVG